MTDQQLNFADLVERTKRMIRRAILKGVTGPGYQMPFGCRKMPNASDLGRGGVQAAIIETRHRNPETVLTETRKMHGLEEYGQLHVNLCEAIARHRAIATAFACAVKVKGQM